MMLFKKSTLLKVLLMISEGELNRFSSSSSSSSSLSLSLCFLQYHRLCKNFVSWPPGGGCCTAVEKIRE